MPTKPLYIEVYYKCISIYTKMINMAKTILHSPTLNTVMMVEDVLKKSGLITIANLKKELQKQVMHQTLVHILDYLQLSGKIIIGTKGILWVFAERKDLNKLIARGTEL